MLLRTLILIVTTCSFCIELSAQGDVRFENATPSIDVANLASSMGIHITVFDFAPDEPYCLQLAVVENGAGGEDRRKGGGYFCGLEGANRLTVHRRLEPSLKFLCFINAQSDGTGGSTGGVEFSTDRDENPGWHGWSAETTPNLTVGTETALMRHTTHREGEEPTEYVVLGTMRPNPDRTIGGRSGSGFP